MNEKEKLERQIGPLMNKLQKIRDKESREENKKLIGRCGRYLNSYGNDRPDWWLYRKVMGLTKSGGLNVFSFQETCLNVIKIEHKDYAMGASDTLGVKITEKQFQVAWDKMQKKIEGLEP